MIKSSSLKNLWLFKSSHLNALRVDGIFVLSKRGKATALNLAENLDESTTNGKKNSKATALKAKNSNTDNNNISNENDSDGNSNNNNGATTNLTEAKQQSFYNKNVWMEDRSKYGHSGKELQDKIAHEY